MLNELTATQAAYLTKTELTSLSASQSGTGLSTTVLDALTATQIGDFTATQVGNLTSTTVDESDGDAGRVGNFDTEPQALPRLSSMRCRP